MFGECFRRRHLIPYWDSADDESLFFADSDGHLGRRRGAQGFGPPLHKHRMPKYSKLLRPSAKLNRMRDAVNRTAINRFLREASKMDALTGIPHFFGSFASDIARYFIFCELSGRPTSFRPPISCREMERYLQPGGRIR